MCDYVKKCVQNIHTHELGASQAHARTSILCLSVRAHATNSMVTEQSRRGKQSVRGETPASPISCDVVTSHTQGNIRVRSAQGIKKKRAVDGLIRDVGVCQDDWPQWVSIAPLPIQFPW